MGDVVNLRQVRRRRARAQDAATAEANRAKFGRTKAERQAIADERDRATAMLEGHRRDPAADIEA